MSVSMVGFIEHRFFLRRFHIEVIFWIYVWAVMTRLVGAAAEVACDGCFGMVIYEI
jgi:hypothetical protein